MEGARPDQVALALAEAKALAVGAGDRPVLGSDSLVVVGDRRFDKPASRAEAAEHLRVFSGRPMQLHSAAAIARGGAVVWRHAAIATLQVRVLSDEFIESYLDAEWPAVSHCVGRVPDRGARRATVRADRGRSLHRSRHAAPRGARCAARDRVSCRHEPRLCRGDRRSHRAVEVTRDPRLLARQARHRRGISRVSRHCRRAGRLHRRPARGSRLARMQRDDAAQAGGHAISRPARDRRGARRCGQYDNPAAQRGVDRQQYRRRRLPRTAGWRPRENPLLPHGARSRDGRRGEGDRRRD